MNNIADIRTVGHRSLDAAVANLRVDYWVLAAVMLAVGLRLVRLDAAPLWLDEVVTATWVDLPWGDAVRSVMADRHPPLYILLLKAWAVVAGRSDWSLRAFSVVASCMFVLLSAALTRLMAGSVAARWAAWLAACSPYVVHHGQEARMYPLVMALAAGQLTLFVRVLLGRRERLGWGFAVIAVALTATHYYAGFLILGELLALALLPRGSARLRVNAFPALVAGAFAIASMLAAAAFASHGQRVSEYDLGPLVGPGALWALLGGYELLPSPGALHADGLSSVWSLVPMAVVSGSALAVTLLYGLRSLPTAMRTVALATLGAVFGGAFAADAIAGVGFHPRYLATGMPMFIVLLAAGAPRRLGWNVRSVSIVVVSGTMVLATALHLTDPGHGREDVRAAGRWLDEHVPADEEVLVTSFEMEILARYHWPQHRFRLYPDTGSQTANEANSDALAGGLPFSQQGRAVYVFGRAWLSDPSGALRRSLVRQYARCEGTQARGIEVLCLEKQQR
ncbi:MAG TPA: glycosyltransferase family 39 protein [Candidatus Dormibacteraeota bacterium]|nr:glycosyltransferase family 39 protein [Candidatus Dormibacteraeota bacterium]